jgi:MYXO-CTERM domain-containing protein
LLEWSSPRTGEWRVVVEATDESGVSSGPHVITLRVSDEGGGGGALAWGWLALLGLAVLRARRLQT